MRFKLILFSDSDKTIGTYDLETSYPDKNLGEQIDLGHLSEMLSLSLESEIETAVRKLLFLDSNR